MSYAGEWKPKFLSNLKRTKVARLSARLAGIPWPTVMSARRDDASFRRAWEAAIAAPSDPDKTVTLTLTLTTTDLAKILREQIDSEPEQN